MDKTKGKPRFSLARLFLIATLVILVIGAITSLALGDAALDINVNGTYFVVVHFQLVISMALLSALFACIYYLISRIHGVGMNNALGYIHFWVTAVCVAVPLIPLHFFGIAGAPRRYYGDPGPLDELMMFNPLISIFLLIGGAAQLLFVYNLIRTVVRGRH